MTGLRYLALNRNQISSLSSAIENLTHLTDLNLSGNKLENLPPEIGRLPRLNRLFLSRNWISTLPIELAEAKYLRVLSLSSNPLSEEYRSLVSSSTTQTAHRVLSRLRRQQTAPAPQIDDPPPEIPDPGPGSVFIATEQGYELAPPILADTERSSPTQKTLHTRLRRRLERLQGSMSRIGNTHPALAAEFADYATFLSGDLDDVDVPSLWSAGSGLFEFVRAFDEQNLHQTVTEPLEPEVLGGLRGLIRDHTAFVLGFAAGRDLMERAEQLRRPERPLAEIKATSVDILRPMVDFHSLLTEQAQRLVSSLLRAFNEFGTESLSLIASGSETAKNGVIAFGRAVHPLLILAGGVDVIRMLAGDAQVDTLRMTLNYLHDNGPAVAAFASIDPQLSSWLT